jgi:hypothetical protein
MVESFGPEIIMVWMLRIAPFAAMLTLGALLAVSRDDGRRRRLTIAFVALVLTAQVGAGILQRDFWPFSSYPVIPESASRFREAVWYEIRAVDRHGNESLVDASPLTRSVIEKWAERVFPSLSETQKQRAAAFLLSRPPSCSNRRYLGPLTAPDWLMHYGGAPAGNQVALRVYRADPEHRTLAYEYRAR